MIKQKTLRTRRLFRKNNRALVVAMDHARVFDTVTGLKDSTAGMVTRWGRLRPLFRYTCSRYRGQPSDYRKSDYFSQVYRFTPSLLGWLLYRPPTALDQAFLASYRHRFH